MDTKKKLLIATAAALIIIGFVVTANAMAQGGWSSPLKGWRHGNTNKTGISDGLGLPENATRQQIDDAIWEKQLKDLGLTEQSTLAEYRQALKAKMESARAERQKDMLTKLGLPENATQDDLRNAMSQNRNESGWKRHGIGGFEGRPMGGPRGGFGPFGGHKGCTAGTEQ